MRILDFYNHEVEAPDLSRGYLKDACVFKGHHPAVEAVEEQGHYEVIAVYPNGGKDVEWVVDVPGVEAQEAWDEYEDVLRYVLYNAEELAAIKAERAKPTLEQRMAVLEKLVEKIAAMVSAEP